MRFLDVKQQDDIWHEMHAQKISGSSMVNVFSSANYMVKEVKDLLDQYEIEYKASLKKDELFDLLPAEEQDELNAKFGKKELLWSMVAASYLKAPASSFQLSVAQAMQRGHDLEGTALDLCEKETGHKFLRSTVVASDEFDMLFVSPDGITKDGKVGCEVKCLHYGKHFKMIETDERISDYDMQLVTYFVVCDEMQKIYFTIYDDRFVDKKLQYKSFVVTRSDMQEQIDKVRGFMKFVAKWQKKMDKKYNKLEF